MKNMKLYDGSVRCLEHMDASSYAEDTEEQCTYCPPVQLFGLNILINGNYVGGMKSATLEEIREAVDCVEREEHEGGSTYCSYCNRVDWFIAGLRVTGEAMYTDYEPAGEPGVDVVVGYALPPVKL